MAAARKRGLMAPAAVLLLLVIWPGIQFGKVKPLYMYYDFFYGARSLSMGNAFTAVANDLTAVYRNPAGLAEMDGSQLFIDYRKDKLLYRRQPENDTGGLYPREYTYESTSDLKNFDFLSIAVPVYFWDIDWNFALSYYRYIPYGFRARGLGALTTTPNGAAVIEENRLLIQGSSGIDVLGFTSAFYLTEFFSFGVTLQRFFNSGEIIYDWSTPGAVYNQAYTEKIKGMNVVLGVLVKPNKNITLGFNYHTRVSGTLESRYHYEDITHHNTPADISTEAHVTIPPQLALGIGLKLFRYMLFSFDYSVIYWEKAALSGYFDSTGELKFPVKDDFPFSQQNAVNYRLGVEIDIPIKKSTLFLRGGWFSDGQLFTDAFDKAVKIKGYSLGIGVDISSMFKLDIGYMKQNAAWNETAFLNPQDTVGTDFSNKIFSISLTFGFNKKKI